MSTRVAMLVAGLLLALAELMMGKRLLPWFGGGAGVWTVVVAGTVPMGLAGLGLGRVLRRLVPRPLLAAAALLGLTLIALLVRARTSGAPLLPTVDRAPDELTTPIAALFGLLLPYAALPIVALVATLALLSERARRPPPLTEDWHFVWPFGGALSGLVLYPFVLEPRVARLEGLWAFAFTGLVVLVGWLATQEGSDREARSPTDWRRDGVSVGLAATAALFLLATTARLSQALLATPAVWAVTGAIYLVGLAIPLGRMRWASARFWGPVLAVSTALVWASIRFAHDLPIRLQLVSQLIALLAVGMVCHGELARRSAARAGPVVGLGAAIGAGLAAFVAPLVFDSSWEYSVTLLGCWLWYFGLTFRASGRLHRVAVAGFLVAQAVLLGLYVQAFHSHLAFASRSFLGAVRVNTFEDDTSASVATLVRENLIVGREYADEGLKKTPTGIFNRFGGAGLALEAYQPRQPRRVGVLGLGIGTPLVFGKANEEFRFYEADPAVVALARGEGGWFQTLERSKSKVTLVPGEPRLRLERELAAGDRQRFDVLLVDWPPVHLLTEEAFALYLQHLDADGIIAVNLRHQDLNLRPVLISVAKRFGLGLAICTDRGGFVFGDLPSTWALLTRNRAFLDQPAVTRRADLVGPVNPEFRPWTDASSNVLRAIDSRLRE